MNQKQQDWEACAHVLAAALHGLIKRYQIALAEQNQADEPVFETPAPSRLDNIKAIGEALMIYEKTKATE